MNQNTQLTCVSGFWKIKNKHDNKFEQWFKNTLKINCPYVFFGNEEAISMVKKYRQELPTHYIELNIEDFETYKYRDNMKIDNNHCPSIELNLIWNEKIFMIQKAMNINPFCSDFFCWVDAGISFYRNTSPPLQSFPCLSKLENLPQNKFIYSSSETINLNRRKFKKGMYYLYHHISGMYLLHKSIINNVVSLYTKYLSYIDKEDIWTDQVILTLMFKDTPELFYKYCDGYGTIIPNLF
jgi:hypothetical protein